MVILSHFYSHKSVIVSICRSKSFKCKQLPGHTPRRIRLTSFQRGCWLFNPTVAPPCGARTRGGSRNVHYLSVVSVAGQTYDRRRSLPPRYASLSLYTRQAGVGRPGGAATDSYNNISALRLYLLDIRIV